MSNKLPHPATFGDLALPMRARQLSQRELDEIEAAARTGLYSVLAIAQAYELSRSLAFSLFARAINPRKFNASARTHKLPQITDEERAALRSKK